MHWAAPLDPQRALQILIDTLYDKICNKVLHGLQSSKAVQFRTRFSRLLTNDQNPSLNFIDHYPYDKALFKPLGATKEEKEKKQVKPVSSTQLNKLLKSTQITFIDKDALDKV
jgi:hypothetical protein